MPKWGSVLANYSSFTMYSVNFTFIEILYRWIYLYWLRCVNSTTCSSLRQCAKFTDNFCLNISINLPQKLLKMSRFVNLKEIFFFKKEIPACHQNKRLIIVAQKAVIMLCGIELVSNLLCENFRCVIIIYSILWNFEIEFGQSFETRTMCTFSHLIMAHIIRWRGRYLIKTFCVNKVMNQFDKHESSI